jgi:alginate O-acetyltransferase complex protein AlgI
MLFTDVAFLFYFLPAALCLLWLLSRSQVGKPYGQGARFALFGLTLAFYGFREPIWLIPFFLCIGFDFLWASLLFRTEDPRWRRLLLWLSVGQSLSLLAVFKYWPFLRENAIWLWPSLKPYLPLLVRDDLPFPLPAGISFYTFESMSFVFDVYRGEIRGPVRPRDFFPFIGMFPRFVAGPVVRYREVVPQLERFQGMKLESGLALFGLGLFLKCGFADSFSVFVQYAFGRQGAPIDVLAAWIGSFAYTLQLYFDFSGYSLMAIGLGRCLGFDFPPNFNRPYHAVSMRDFWARWHMSFTSWIRDYLFNPLALMALRRSRIVFYGVVVLTIFLSGLWHGANWTYVVWGAWNGALLALEYRFALSKKLPSWLRKPVTFLQVLLGFVFFRADTLSEAGHVLRSMLWPSAGPWDFNWAPLAAHPIALTFSLLGIAYCFWFEGKVEPARLEAALDVPWAQKIATAALMALAVLTSLAAQNVPFLYFQF